MKKSFYLIILLLILGLVLTGCFLSNIGQIPANEKKPEPEGEYTKFEPMDLVAGQNTKVGTVNVWNDGANLYVKYVIEDPTEWCLTETHLHVAKNLDSIPQKNGNPIPGKFDHKGEHDCLDEFLYTIPFDGLGTELFIAAHAVVKEMSCYQTAILYGIQRYTGTVYGVDVLAGTSWMEFDIEPPPSTGSATPNGLAYDVENGLFYYCSYQETPNNKLYFWDSAQYFAGSLIGDTAAATFYDGKYYYITGPPSSDDLYVVEFETDGTIKASFPAKVEDIANNAHGWTFNGDIAIKDGVVYGWGLCSTHGYEFFTYDLDTGVFNVNTVSYSSSLQIAFGSNGTLYGHRSGGVGAFYVVDTTNGDVSLVTPTPSPGYLYTDCASGMICEPATETAWAANINFSGKNWATYFKYTVQE